MLRKLGNWLKSQLQKIRESNDEELLKRIKGLQTQLDDTVDLNNNLLFYTEELMDRLSFLEETIENLKVNKHDSLQNYYDWLDNNTTDKATYYDFGKGRKQVHTIFADSLKDEEYVRVFVDDILGFNGGDFETADDLIYDFNRLISREYPTRNYYDSDQNLYGQLEYWATAKETIIKLLNEGKAFDCDDSMTLRYTCLYYLLQDFFPDDVWRLRGFIVDIWTGGGHALLAWVKEGPNDWIPIESTFYDDRIFTIWNNNYRIRNQMLYQIRYSFDDKHEYVRI